MALETKDVAGSGHGVFLLLVLTPSSPAHGIVQKKGEGQYRNPLVSQPRLLHPPITP